MKFEFQLSQDEYVLAQNLHCSRKIRVSPIVKIGFGLICATAGILFVESGQTGIEVSGYALLPVGAYFLTAPWLIPWVVRFRAKRGYTEHKAIQQIYTFNVSEQGVEHRSGLSAGETSWNLYTSFIESKDLFLLYLSPNLFQVIPKRAIAVEDLASFRELVASKVASKK